MLDQIRFDLESEIADIRRSALRSLIQSKSVTHEQRVSLLRQVALSEQEPELRSMARKYLDVFSGEQRLEDAFRSTSVEENVVPGHVFQHGSQQDKIDFLKGVPDKSSVTTEQIRGWLSSEKDVFVIATLLSCLGRIGSEQNAMVVIPFLSNSDARIRANAVDTLYKLNNEETFQHAVPLLQDTDARVKSNAARIFSSKGLSKTLEIFKQMIDSGKVHQIESAIFALKHIKDERAQELRKIAEHELTERMKADDFFEFDFAEDMPEPGDVEIEPIGEFPARIPDESGIEEFMKTGSLPSVNQEDLLPPKPESILEEPRAVQQDDPLQEIISVEAEKIAGNEEEQLFDLTQSGRIVLDVAPDEDDAESEIDLFGGQVQDLQPIGGDIPVDDDETGAKPAENQCPKCKNANPENASICLSCGTLLQR